MDFEIPGLIDHREAGRHTCFDVTEARRHIYMRDSPADRMCVAQPESFDTARIPTARRGRRRRPIVHVVLHSTGGSPFEHRHIDDSRRGPNIPRIIAHFVVMNDGTLLYTHDVEFALNDAGLATGIDIEFTGHFSNTPEPHIGPVPPRNGRELPDHVRLSPDAIRAGRRLLTGLRDAIDTIRYIHPHGQIESPDREPPIRPLQKTDSCPGPDVWVNVGMWAVARLGWSTDDSHLPADRRHGISEAQSDPSYDQHIDGM